MGKCVVSGCPNRNDNNKVGILRPCKRFFNFPKDQARVKVWLAALRETEKKDSTEQHIICEDHFLTDHITPRGISEDAIPIMPPYLDGPLGLISPWGADSSEEEEEEFAGDDAEAADTHDSDEDVEDDGVQSPSETETSSPPKQGEGITQRKGATVREDNTSLPGTRGRQDLSLGTLTKRFLELMRAAPDGVLDLNQVARSLQTRKRRVYDITNVLDGIHLVKKQSPNKIKWIGSFPVNCFIGRKQNLEREMENLKVVEETLDDLIKTCAQQLFDMADSTENLESAYVTHEDITRIKVFQEQTLIAIKAPEETKLEVPTPKEDGIQIHLKGGRGPIKVLTCEIGRPQGPGNGKLGGFLTLEESRIKAMPLSTDSLAPQKAVQSA